LAAGLFYVWLSTPRGRYDFDYFKYTMPIFGKLMYLLDFSRLMQCTLLNLQNGMRIQDSLEVSKSVVKNTVMMSMVETAINNIFIGQSWIEPFEEAGLGDAMCIEMLKIGMQTDLPEMIDKMLDYVESDINNTLEKIVKVLPEISYIFVGVVLIFFVCAVLVPCISMYMGGWLFSAYDV
jgi:type II secretory pathway component PulF